MIETLAMKALNVVLEIRKVESWHKNIQRNMLSYPNINSQGK